MSTWDAPRRAWRPYIEASALLQTRLDEDLRAAAGMSLSDYNVLLVLSESAGYRLRMRELAVRMVFSPSRLTYQVKAMEQRGWVVRQSSREDRRGSYAVLTAAGVEALRAADEHHMGTVRRLFTDDLDEREADVLASVFTRLRARLRDSRAAEVAESASAAREQDQQPGGY